jgi:hypothetical protein
MPSVAYFSIRKGGFSGFGVVWRIYFFGFANFYVAYVDYVGYYVDYYVVCNSMKRGCNLPSLKSMSPIKESMRDNICNGP